MPVLETRYQFNRLAPPFEGMAHVDMLHVARRFWRSAPTAPGAWPDTDSCRLSALERMLFGVRRVGDVGGHHCIVNFRQGAPFFWRLIENRMPTHLIPPATHEASDGEAIIGITFVVAAAGVILLLSRVSGGKEELEHLLTGDILNVQAEDVGKRVALFVALGLFYRVFHSRFARISETHDDTQITGFNVRLWDFLFYAAFAIVVVSFVRVAGVLLTFTYLIVPAVCSVMLFDTWPRRLAAGSAIAAFSSLAGDRKSTRLSSSHRT